MEPLRHGTAGRDEDRLPREQTVAYQRRGRGETRQQYATQRLPTASKTRLLCAASRRISSWRSIVSGCIPSRRRRGACSAARCRPMTRSARQRPLSQQTCTVRSCRGQYYLPIPHRPAAQHQLRRQRIDITPQRDVVRAIFRHRHQPLSVAVQPLLPGAVTPQRQYPLAKAKGRGA